MNARDLMNIRAMDDRVDRQRHARLGDIAGERALALPRAFVMAEAVVGLLVRALEGKLRMVEAGFRPIRRSSFSLTPMPEVMRFVYSPLCEAWRVRSTMSRRAVGSPPVRCTCSAPSAAASLNTRLPGLAVKLIAGALERHRIGAIETAERTTMGEFDQKPDRRSGRGRNMSGHVSRTLLVLRSASMATTSFSITAGGAA